MGSNMQDGSKSEEVESEGDQGTQNEEALPFLRRMHLGVSRQYYSCAQALGLSKLQDYFQGANFPASNGPIWLLGEKYELATDPVNQKENEQVMANISLDFTSRLWMTYRQGFLPIGSQPLGSDAGWGCTLRSGQMLLAQVLLHHICGRLWRRGEAELQEHSDVVQLLSLFWDNPGSQHPFSIHNLVAAGKRFGIVAGEWLGPWTLCQTLAQAVNKLHPSGLHVHLAITPGGSAPVLYTACVEGIFEGQAIHNGSDLGEKSEQRSVLILVPLVLGIGKVNPRYIPQLKAVLEWPQSAGIVGGRPSSSLYFIGHQNNSIIFLDPHTLQECGSSWRDVKMSYFCNTPRAISAESIDPSLAIGFYCRTLDSFKDLASRLKGLEELAGGAPLMNIVDGIKPMEFNGLGRKSSVDPGGHPGEEPWELL